jgi:uncharacterized protein (TIGR02996 family)
MNAAANSRDAKALMRAILDNPDDDLPRLAYADWLDETGDATDRDRAEFIRVQIELAATYHLKRRDSLSDRNHKLLSQYGDTWAADIVGRGVNEVRFERGFVAAVTATGPAFIRRGDAWTAGTPLRNLTLRGVAGNAARLAGCPHLARISSLTIADNQFSDYDLAALVRSRYWLGLSELCLSGSSSMVCGRIGDHGLAALASSSVLASLTDLTIDSDGSIGSAGVKAIADATVPTQMQRLQITETSIDDRGAMALAGGAGLSALKDLRIAGGAIGSEGIVALLRSPHMVGLAHAWVPYHLVSGEIIRALADAPFGPHLKFLDFSNNPLGTIDLDAVAAVLQSHPGLTMSLRDCSIPRSVQMDMKQRFPDQLYLDKEPQSRPRTQISG